MKFIREIEEMDAYDRMCFQYEQENGCYRDYNDDCGSAEDYDYSPSNPWNAPGMSIKDFL